MTKARGTKIGGDLRLRGRLGAAASVAVRKERAANRAARLAPVIAELRQAGAATLKALAAGLNRQNIPAPRGGTWSGTQVRQLLAQIEGAG
jgi:hypothetical protein